jgi:hypothetical protein
MSPRFWTRVATRLFAVRWWLMAGSLSSFSVLAWSMATGLAQHPRFYATLAVPLIFLPWGLFCACLWFHPERGTLRQDGGFLRWFPWQAQVVARWWAAMFLGVYCLVAAVGMPLFALLAG